MRSHEAIPITEIAHRLGGISRVTVYAWLESGRVPGRKQDARGRFYVDRRVFEAWLEAVK